MIDNEAVKHLAQLARIELKPEEVVSLQKTWSKSWTMSRRLGP